MKKVLVSFLLGLGAGWGGYWYVDHHPVKAWQAQQKVLHQVENAAHSIQEKISEITVQAVKEQLARSGVYIVEKTRAAGAVVADTATDARISAAVKAKLFGEPGLSAMTINVDTAGGVVTLSGVANSPEQITRAVQIAMGTEGVRKVVSSLQVKPEAK